MKPIRVQWVPGREWRVIWGAVAVAAVTAFLAALWQWQGHQTVLAHAQEKQNALLTQIDALRRPSKPLPPAVGKLRQQVQTQMLLDLNPVFATIEGMQLPGVQLRNLNVDAGSGAVRVEYTLDSVAQASLVSERLNAGYDKKPWALTGVVVNVGSGSGGMTMVPSGLAVGNGGGASYTGLWVAGFQSL